MPNQKLSNEAIVGLVEAGFSWYKINKLYSIRFSTYKRALALYNVTNPHVKSTKKAASDKKKCGRVRKRDVIRFTPLDIKNEKVRF